MGAKDSKTCISYDEAVRRVSANELKRIKEAFKRSAGAGNASLSKAVFIHDVLGDGVPGVVAEWLYTNCGGTGKGIQFKELICGLVLLTKGTVDEKIKFLWNLYSNDAGTVIVRSDFLKALQSELIYQSNHSRVLLASGGSAINLPQQPSATALSLFGPADRVAFEQFRAWVNFNRSATVLSRWLLLEPYVHLTSDMETPTFFQSLAGVTHLEEQDIRDLERVFCRLKANTKFDQLDLESVGPLLSPPIPTTAVAGVFNAFDENRDGHIDFKELCCGVSAACRGPTVERCKFLFKVFDQDRDGQLNGAELNHMVDNLIHAAKDNCSGVTELTRTIILKEIQSHALKRNNNNNNSHSGNEGSNSIDELVEASIGCSGVSIESGLDHQQPHIAVSLDDLQLSQEAFLMWSVESPLNLVQQFLDLLFDVCHIVLGLRPQCRHIERDIVKGWMAREERRGYKVGQFWYLISSEWWQIWLNYVQSAQSGCNACKSAPNYGPTSLSLANSSVGNQSPNMSNINLSSNGFDGSVGGGGSTSNTTSNISSSHSVINSTKNTTTTTTIGNNINNNGVVDEAIICDESYTSNLTESGDTSSLGSGSSSGISSLGRHSTLAGATPQCPGPIDNRCLVETAAHKGIQTLTGEGGRLKRDTTLAQHRDFELVPDSLWRALSLWYNGPLALPRQVIQPNNLPDVELELYPLNLRILRHQNPQPATGNTSGSNALSSSAWGGGYGGLTNTGSGSSAVAQALQQPKKYLAYLAAFSKLATVRQVAEFLCQRLKLRLEDVRLWHTNSNSLDIPYLLEEEHLTLADLSVSDNDQILLEVRNKDLTWPEELGALSALNSSSGGGGGGVSGANLGIVNERRPTIDSLASTHAAGATGLQNLGNTCFMNAALQVLFNTQPLTQYFCQNMHMIEVNRTNTMGTHGQLAMRYAELLKEVWNNASPRSVAPLKLRFCITKHNNNFAGGGQHDSQELLAWLLDKLHEDLNRVTDRTYRELKDSNGRADSVVAREAWTHHYARNESIVIDLFCGQLKSKVSCLACGHDSVRFDPFNVLNLPLPVENYTYCEVLVILLDGSVPIKYGLRLNSEAKYKNLKYTLSELCGRTVEPELMLCCEIAESQLRCILPDDLKIKPSTATEIYVYELPKGGCCNRPRTSSELGVNIEKGLKDIQRNPALLLSTDPNATTSSTQSLIAAQDSMRGSQNQLVINSDDGQQHVGDEDDAANSSNGRLTNRRSSKQSDEVSTSPENSFIVTRMAATEPKPISQTETVSCQPQQKQSLSEQQQKQQQHQQHSSKSEQKHHNRTPITIGKMKTVSRTNLLASDDLSMNSEPDDVHASVCVDDENSDEDNHSSIDEKQSGGGNKKHNQSHSKDCTSNNSGNPRDCMYKSADYVVAVHRQLCRQDTYFLQYHKTRPNLFGVPLLVPCYENCTNKDLYCAVWIQVARFLSPLPPNPPDHQANHATDCDDSLGYEFPFKLKAVAQGGGRVCAFCAWTKFCRGCEIPCNDEPLLQGILNTGAAGAETLDDRRMNVSAVSSPILTQTARAVNMTKNGSSDVNLSRLDVQNKHRRTQSEQIMQPETPPGGGGMNHHQQQQPTRSKSNLSAINVAIDWDPTALYLRYQSTREKLWNDHPSVATCRRQQTEPVDLDHCLRAFTSEEKLEESYHCSRCKALKPATKKLQIWKLPPILVVHLKRFNDLGNNKWVKSQKVVHFPFQDFDPTPYLASVPQETILRHRDLTAMGTDGAGADAAATQLSPVISLRNCDIPESSDEQQEEDDVDEDVEEEEERDVLEMSAKNKLNEGRNDETEGMEKHKPMEDSHPASMAKATNRRPTIVPKVEQRRQRLISGSLTKTPVIDGDLIDYHKHRLKQGCDEFELKYRLYAVVSHSGMLNGGHYISYASNPNGLWYCYNDSSCREIPQRPNIDPGSAYLLFYERQGLDYNRYLPNLEGKTIPNGSAMHELDDYDNDVKKMCAIS